MKKKITLVATSVLLVAAMVIGGTLAYFTDTKDQTNTFTVGNVKITLDEQDVNNPKARTEDDQTYGTLNPGKYFVKDPTITVNEGSQDAYIFMDITMNKYKSLAPVMALDAAADASISYTQQDVDACMKDNKFSTQAFLQQMQTNPDVFRAIVNKWFVGIEHANWEVCGIFYNVDKEDTAAEGNWMTIRLAYIGAGDAVMSAKENVKFMNEFGMPASVTQEMLDNGLTTNQFNEGDPFQMKFTAYAIQEDTIEDVDAAFTALFGDLGSYWTQW